MLANSSLVSCNYASSLAFHSPGPRFPIQTQTSNPKFSPLLLKASFTSLKATRFPFPKKGDLQVSCHGVLNDSEKDEVLEGEANGKEGRDWTTSILLLAFWVAVLYYVFFLTPNQTPFKRQDSRLAIPCAFLLWWCVRASALFCSVETASTSC
uniref:Uncharacterized protein MANES_13G060700 n=1 Tax=Rhizophora mucronata TaxID=61149 RepID=A0A2P2MLV7_RHIMU